MGKGCVLVGLGIMKRDWGCSLSSVLIFTFVGLKREVLPLIKTKDSIVKFHTGRCDQVLKHVA